MDVPYSGEQPRSRSAHPCVAEASDKISRVAMTASHARLQRRLSHAIGRLRSCLRRVDRSAPSQEHQLPGRSDNRRNDLIGRYTAWPIACESLVSRTTKRRGNALLGSIPAIIALRDMSCGYDRTNDLPQR